MKRRDLVVFVSSMIHETQKLHATKYGSKRIKATSVYHQWRYSFKKLKKYHRKRMTAMMGVRIDTVTAPHLIGKQMQQV